MWGVPQHRCIVCWLSISLASCRCAATESTSELVNLWSLDSLHGRKCGVAVNPKNEGRGPGFTPAMLKSGDAYGLAWQTSWTHDGIQPGFSPADYGSVALVSQFWDATDVDFVLPSGPIIPVMLGFNEPDQSFGGGAGMDVTEAVNSWMYLVGKARMAGYQYFVAPSIAQGLPSRYTGQSGGNEWLPQFLQGCLEKLGCAETVDYLGFHLYEPRCPTDPAVVRKWSMDVRVGSMKRLMLEFNGKGMNIKGLWLTEFAGRSDGAGLCRTLAQQRGWLEVIVPMLNSDPAIVAYSWFSYGDGHSPFFHDNANLWDYSTNQPNELGQAYFRLCSTRPAGGGTSVRLVFLWMIAIVILLIVIISVVSRCNAEATATRSGDVQLGPLLRR
mmetsp:Transcript_69602/g.148891  ORF Transcript_69602/g.148891 Transcript_69602/m.148891 type:complete len:385 (+) Transcript_69602:51-1205(+)